MNKVSQRNAKIFGSDCIINPNLLVDRGGYPFLAFGHASVKQVASRIVYRLFVGELPHWQVVSYRCGNKGCLNPNHLYLREHSDAIADQPDHPNRRLTAEDYWYIRRSPLGLRQLGKKFNYSPGTLGSIRRRAIGRTERFSFRYALLVLWERVSGKGRLSGRRAKSAAARAVRATKRKPPPVTVPTGPRDGLFK